MKDFEIEKESRGSIQIVRLAGSLDMYSFTRLETQLNALFDEGQYCLVLDCRRLDYVGSAGLGALVSLAKRAREHKGDVRLLGVPDRIYKIIELLGFTKVLVVYDTEEKAVASFQGQ